MGSRAAYFENRTMYSRSFNFPYDPAAGRTHDFIRELGELGFDFTAHHFRLGITTIQGSKVHNTTAYRVPPEKFANLDTKTLEEVVTLKDLCTDVESFWPTV